MPLFDIYAFQCGFSAQASATELEAWRGSSTPPVGTLVDDRFETRVTWTGFDSSTGYGNPVELTSHANYFWFFSADDPHLFLKIVDNTDTSGYYSVIANALGNVEYEIEIIDTCNNQLTKTYIKPLGVAAAVVDLMAFPETGVCLFSDGFESGDLSGWSGGSN